MSAPGVVLEPRRGAALRALIGTDVGLRLFAGLAILIVWEVVVRLWAPAFVARPSGIVAAFPVVLASPAFWDATRVTLVAVAQGLLIAFIAGTLIGLAIGRIRAVERLLEIYINGLFAMPMVAILPLLTLWFGYSGTARIATVVFASIFAIILNVADGARAVPPEYVEVSRSFRGSSWSRVFDVILPASMPYILAGLRLAAGRALIGAVVAEFFTAINGLGYFILFNSRTFHHNEAFVGVLLLAGFGVGFDTLVNWSTHRFLPWYRRDEVST